MQRKYLTEWKKFLTEQTGSSYDPDFDINDIDNYETLPDGTLAKKGSTQEIPGTTVYAPYRNIDLTITGKGRNIYKKTDMESVRYHHDGKLINPVTGEKIATVQPRLTDEEVIDWLWKNRNVLD